MKIRSLIYICSLLLISFKGYGQSCTLDVTLSKSAPTVCSGNSITLTATTTGGTPPFTYVWNTGETTASINVNKAGTYSISVSDKTPGCQPILKNITVTASNTPNAPSVQNVKVCPNNTATLTATAPGGVYQWYDAAGNFLYTGATYVTQPITAQTIFYVQTTVNACTSARTPVTVSLPAKPNITPATVCTGNVATLMASGGDSYVWYDAPNGGNIVSNDADFTTPVLTASKTYYVAVTSNGCTSALTPVTATVSAPPQPPVVTNQVICSGSVVILHADAPAGLFNWFTTPTGGTPLITSPDYTTPPLTATTTYYVQTSINDCISKRVAVKVTVNTPPQAPATQTQTICYQSSAVINVGNDPQGTHTWYDAPTGGNLIATGSTYTTPVLTNSTSYYVQISNGSCSSDRTQINIIVKPILDEPSAAGAIICNGGVATLTATSEGGTYAWYNAATGGKSISNNANFTTPSLTATTSYYVQRTFQGCVSPRAKVTVTLLPALDAPTASNTSTCYGNIAVVSATSSTGNYSWYDAATGGNLLSTGQVYVTPALTKNTTYYVETSTINGCTSPRKAVLVTINPIPAKPIVKGVTTCTGNTATLTASAAGGTIEWYGTATGSTMLATGNTFTTPVLTNNTTYYVQNTSASCSSDRVPVTVTINSLIDPQFLYSLGTYCTSTPNQTPKLFNTAGGTFSISPAGLVLVNNKTGEINLNASTPGIYTVSFIGNDACPHVSTEKILVSLTAEKSDISYNSPYCQYTGKAFPNFLNGSSAGVFSATPSGLVFTNVTTGEIDLDKSSPGTYKVTNTTGANGSCTLTTSSTQVVIAPGVLVDAGPSQTVSIGSKVQLAGSVKGAVSGGKWSGGAGTFSNATDLNAIYTPGTGETIANLTLTSDDPAGSCGPRSNQVTIYFKPGPTAPTAPGTSVCAGTSAILSATAPGGYYQWFNVPAGGSMLASGPSFTTPLLTSNTTYYVQATLNGLTSTRTAVNVVVNAELAAPIVQAAPACAGSVTTLTASGSAGTYEWYDAPAGGNLLATGTTYVTPSLSLNTSYYVQARINTCISPRTKFDLVVTPPPHVTSTSNGINCSGNPLGYTITADEASATFVWSRAQVNGISTPAVSPQTSNVINEILINTTINPITVVYDIVPVAGSCSGPDFKYSVIVYPQPVVTSTNKATICNYNTDDYQITFNTPSTLFSWSRAAIPGVSNAAVSGQNSNIIKEILFNTSNTPVDVPYTINYKTSTCDGTPFILTMTVNPTATVTSAATGTACSAEAQDYVITSNVPSATFRWSRSVVSNISNLAVSNQTSSTINETLINKSGNPVKVIYIITPLAYGCDGTSFKYTVTVNPVLSAPVANSNSPVCLSSTIRLLTPTVPNVTYLWTGPNGFTSNLQNPEIVNATAANAGEYTLVTIARGCQSPPSTVIVSINQPATAVAGPDQTTCKTTIEIALNGTITGGTTTGNWTTAGSGTFKPSSDVLNAQYFPSDADRTAGSVILTLASTSKDDCNISMSNTTITFSPQAGVSAGPNQEVCSQEPAIQLAGKVFTTGKVVWATSGSGTFKPSVNDLNASYVPTPDDIKKGSVTLTLSILSGDVCYTTSSNMVINFMGPPILGPGGTRYVLRGKTIILNPVVNTDSVTYLWSPNIDINDVNAKNPIIKGDVDRFYTLTITDTRGCQTTDTTYIKVSPDIKIDNAFTPNGDGINDLWVITGLEAYTNCTVDIFNRYGQKLFHSVGYPKPWDGTYNGSALAPGVYYYVINTKTVNNPVLSGSITIIK